MRTASNTLEVRHILASTARTVMVGSCSTRQNIVILSTSVLAGSFFYTFYSLISLWFLKDIPANLISLENPMTTWRYIHDFDVVVSEMIEAVGGPDYAPAFMGIGGAAYSSVGGAEWLPPFLNCSKHGPSVPPIDYVSIHHYAGG